MPTTADAGLRAQVTPSISTSPALTPAFDPAITDYVVRCAESNGSVTITANMPAGSSLAINGGSAQTGSFVANVALRPNEKMTWTVNTSGVVKTYYTRCLPPDFPQLTATAVGTAQTQWYMLGVGSFAVIVDARGTPVWWMTDWTGGVGDVKLLSDTGSGPEIAWAVIPTFSFESIYSYEMHRLDGQLIRTVGSGTLDFHDLQRLPSGAYLGLRYARRNCPTTPADCVDESQWGGPASVNPIDAEVVTLDASGNQTAAWSTRNRIALAESAAWIAAGETADIIHINSAESDGAGGFFFSARHTDAVYHVDTTGAIDWKLGGTTTPQSLTVVGDSSGGPLFSGQHDARLMPDGTITVYDNGTLLGRPPRALRFSLNLGTRTATVVENVGDARVGSSPFAGSARRLTGGNWVASWGGTLTGGEITSGGAPVLTITGPPTFLSYRIVPIEPGVLSAVALRAGMDAMLLKAQMMVPTNGESVSGSKWLHARTTGPISATEFHLAGNGLTDRVIGAGVPTPYEWMLQWDSTTVPNGTYSLYLRASKAPNVYVDSAPVSVTVANTPSVVVTLPPAGTAISGSQWLNATTTSFATRVEYRITGKRVTNQLIGTASRGLYGWLFLWNSGSVSPGTYQLVARAVDNFGQGIDSAPVTISVVRKSR